jgi:hypothetical protein
MCRLEVVLFLLAVLCVVHCSSLNNATKCSIWACGAELAFQARESFIVSFRAYAPYDDLVREVGGIIGHDGWTDKPRRNAAVRLPTDFVVVQLCRTGAGPKERLLRANANVKYVD